VSFFSLSCNDKHYIIIIMVQTTSILRIGPTENNLSAIILTKALAAQFEVTNDDSSNVDNVHGTAAADETTTLWLENKYFTAKVWLKEVICDGVDSVTKPTVSKEDGIILVFDALSSNPDRTTTDSGVVTFDSLAATHGLAQRQNICGDLLRLCVGVSLGEHSPQELRGTHHEKEYSRRILWCLDHGYEYVEADLSQEGQQRGHEDRDKDGFARVVEAIQGTMWSSAVVGQTTTQQLKQSYASDKASVEQQPVKEEEEENPYQPPDPSLLKSTKNSKEDSDKDGSQTHADESDNDADAAAVASSLLVNPAEVGAPEMAQLRQDLEAEKVFDKMEGVLKQAKEIRVAAKNGTMTDDERRERAGDAALALVNLMGQFGMEGDDESSVDSEDS
jgi:hypothetical protein